MERSFGAAFCMPQIDYRPRFDGSTIIDTRHHSDGSVSLATEDAQYHAFKTYAALVSDPRYWNGSEASTMTNTHGTTITISLNSSTMKTSRKQTKREYRLQGMLGDIIGPEFTVEEMSTTRIELHWKPNGSYPEIGFFDRVTPDESYTEPSAFDKICSVNTWKQVFRVLTFWQQKQTDPLLYLKLSEWNGDMEHLFALNPTLRISPDPLFGKWAASIDLPEGGVRREYDSDVVVAATRCAAFMVLFDEGYAEHAEAMLQCYQQEIQDTFS